MDYNIPKTIHYCWFGRNPLPREAKSCIASWKKFCPDYEIIQWNEDNFDLNSCDYVRDAYRLGKWAFVSDYARFKILYEQGGIYMDTDVELLKPLGELLASGPYMGCERVGHCNPGLGMAAPSGLTLYREILEYYENLSFDYNDGKPLTVVDHLSAVLSGHGWTGSKEIEEVEGVLIYPQPFLCPMDYKTGRLDIKAETYSIHKYNASWQSGYSRLKTQIKYMLGGGLTEKIIYLKSIFRYWKN